MKYSENVCDLVGDTPLVKLRFGSPTHSATILAKLEGYNPFGSVKDRIAIAMIADAESRGLLKRGSVIIEPTSGNSGVALAGAAAAKGYRLILTMPETVSIDRMASGPSALSSSITACSTSTGRPSRLTRWSTPRVLRIVDWNSIGSKRANTYPGKSGSTTTLFFS